MTSQQFWTFFLDNEHKLYILPLLDNEEQQNYFYWFEKHLGYFCKGLGFEIQFADDCSGPATLIIKALWVEELYPKVYELIDNAPKIDNWKFEALKAPIKNDISEDEVPYEFGNLKMKISELYFYPVKYIKRFGKIVINIYSDKRYTHCKPNDLQTALTIIMEDLLGEKLLSSKIKKFKFYKKNRNRGITFKLTHLEKYLQLINTN